MTSRRNSQLSEALRRVRATLNLSKVKIVMPKEEIVREYPQNRVSATFAEQAARAAFDKHYDRLTSRIWTSEYMVHPRPQKRK